LYSFDPQRLFIKGNSVVDVYTVLDSGFFHIIDAVLIIGGAYIILKRTQGGKGYFLYIPLYTLVGSIPNIIKHGDTWITFRGAFVFVGLIMIAGIGLGSLLGKLRNRWRIAALLMYLLSTSVFFYKYFYNLPISSTASNYFYDRIVASYIYRLQDKNMLLATNNASTMFDSLITYNRLITKNQSPKSGKVIQHRLTPLKTLRL
jgi:hypothetical protein